MNSDILREFPEHALKIAEIAAVWNVLDASMLVLFTVLLAGEDSAAFALYYSTLVHRDADRRKGFEEVAKYKSIDQESMRTLAALWKDIESIRRCRNEVVHALWASIDGESEAIFALRSVRSWAENVHAQITVNQARAKCLTTYIPPKDLALTTRFWKYTLEDLQEIIHAICELLPRVEEMHDIVGRQVFSHRVSEPWKAAEKRLRDLYDRQYPQKQG